MNTRKPGTAEVMQQLLDRLEREVPFDLPMETLCSGICRGCAKKLLEYLRGEMDGWQAELDAGSVPTLGELQRRVRIARKIWQQLAKNELVPPLG